MELDVTWARTVRIWWLIWWLIWWRFIAMLLVWLMVWQFLERTVPGFARIEFAVTGAYADERFRGAMLFCGLGFVLLLSTRMALKKRFQGFRIALVDPRPKPDIGVFS